MDRKELIEKYIEFFKSKNHAEIKNSSLIPENDPTVLFTTAGMHPIVPFLLGQKHSSGKRLCNVQRCIRTGDIEEVGDATHHTFFEMLGNWSLGDYWKKEAIEMSFEFLTKELGIKNTELEVTCFAGDENAEKDKEAEESWKKLGINKIKFLGKKDNWWGPAGETGPCGPDTEIFVKDIEIWNNVFMQYEKDTKGNYKPAKQKNIDTGMGVERTIAILNNLKDNYLTDCFKPIIEKIEKISKKKYKDHQKEMRIIADHIKASCFIIADGITPSNTEQGYVLRRLIRRAIRYGKILMMQNNFTKEIAEIVFDIYSDYKHLDDSKNKILDELEKEENKFKQTLASGLKYFNKISKDKKEISGKNTFLLFQSYGFPIEMTLELAKEKKIKINEKEFQKEFAKHQELSRTASAGKFKSGLADNSGSTTKLHTATHLLLAALKKILKDDSIIQKGSNINPERARFDFSFPRKLTSEEIKSIEDEVNGQIQKSCKVVKKEMTLDEAKKSGATGIFDNKYGDKVTVYTIGNYSKEICTGPHVENTKEIGKFKIKKEESSSSGVRRIKAILE
jgi:alanyl-tRNA synthetase